MKLEITIISQVVRDGVIEIVSEQHFTETAPDPAQLSAKILRREMDTVEEHARQRLINLGWTPPEDE